MMTYGSYLPQGSRILKSCAQIVGLTTAASILGALMVMPAVFAFLSIRRGCPAFTFVTMPVIFAQLPFGGLFAVAFFACLTFAALTSSVSMLELDTAFLVDEFHVSRTTGAIISTLVIMVIGFFCCAFFWAACRHEVPREERFRLVRLPHLQHFASDRRPHRGAPRGACRLAEVP